MVTRSLSRVARLCLTFVVLLHIAACRPRLLGTDDVRLEFVVRGRQTETPERLVRLIRLRLQTAHITANVEPHRDGSVAVTLDRAESRGASGLLSWSGLSFYVPALDTSFVPRDATDLAAIETILPNGQRQRRFEGNLHAVARAIRETRPPPGTRVLIEHVGLRRFGMRVVNAVALADLPVLSAESRGRSIRLTFDAGLSARLRQIAAEAGGASLILARGSESLGSVRLSPQVAATVFDIPLCDSIDVYESAQRNADLLSTSWSSRLERRATIDVAPDWVLSIASILLPIAAALAWLALVRFFDRSHPEPRWLVFVTFLLGACGGELAGICESYLSRASAYLDADVMSLGGTIKGLPVSIVVFTLTVGLVEEGMKYLAGALVAARRREFDEPVDGIVYAAAAALGFAANENVMYLTAGRLGASLVAHRAIAATMVHVLFATIWGRALGAKLVSKPSRVARYVLLAALAHGTWDALLGTPLHWLIYLELLVLGVAFAAAIRAALRHGVLAPNATPRATGERRVIRVGTSGRFALTVFGFLVEVVFLYLEARDIDSLSGRFDLPHAIMTAVSVAFVGFAAWLVAVSVPLDLVIDDLGVTFAGTTRAWDDIIAVETVLGRLPALRLRSRKGDVRIWPLSPKSSSEMQALLSDRIAAARRPSEVAAA